MKCLNNKEKKLHIYLDGKFKPNFFDYETKLKKINQIKFKYDLLMPIIKGDNKSKTIALASIIAKETRDCIMANYSFVYPTYQFDKNFGYGTNFHKCAILDYGVSDIHRKSFKPISTICSK